MKRWVLPTVGLAQSKLAAPAKRAKPGYKITVFKRYSFFGCGLRLTSKRVFIRPLLAESGLSSMAQPISFLRLEQAPPSRSPWGCSSLYWSVAILISSPHHASATCARTRISPRRGFNNQHDNPLKTWPPQTLFSASSPVPAQSSTNRSLVIRAAGSWPT